MRTSLRAIWTRLAGRAVQVRGDLALLLLDTLIVVATYVVLVLLRFDLAPSHQAWTRFWPFVVAALGAHLLATAAFGGYGRTWEHASLDEARQIALAAGAAEAVLIGGFVWANPRRVPLTVLVTGPLVVAAFQGLIRFQSRLFASRRMRSDPRPAGLRVAVVGGGATGAAAVRAMREQPQLGLTPIAIIDDDPGLQGRSLLGVPVRCGVGGLRKLAEQELLHQVMLAVPSGGGDVARRVAAELAGSGVAMRVLPERSAWLDGSVSLRDVRDLRIEDLLGRPQVQLDIAPVRSLIQGKRVLVTGGGGSIGSVIARHISTLEPSVLALLDHDETHLFDAVAELPGRVESILADVRDPVVVEGIFERGAYDVVFHAAAHKHVPILERFACEAVRTNVLGTRHVVDAADRHGVGHLVLVSTDKAAVPTSVMGASKWLAEQILLDRAAASSGYRAVRFGNVLGSRGSVIPTFQRQIAQGGPVTVTDPRMTRYFMSIDESVRLVLQAAALETDWRVVALRMGEQVNVYELARRMIELVGLRPSVDVGIVFTGSRPGEKLRETLVAPGDQVEGGADDPLVGIRPLRLDPDVLAEIVDRLSHLADALDHRGAREALLDIATRTEPLTAET